MEVLEAIEEIKSISFVLDGFGCRIIDESDAISLINEIYDDIKKRVCKNCTYMVLEECAYKRIVETVDGINAFGYIQIHDIETYYCAEFKYKGVE